MRVFQKNDLFGNDGVVDSLSGNSFSSVQKVKQYLPLEYLESSDFQTLFGFDASAKVSFQASLSNPVTVLMPFEGTGVATQLPNSSGSHSGDYAYDFVMPRGTEVLSVADGVVVSVVSTQTRHVTSFSNNSYGNFVTILHNAGTEDQFYATYLHMEPEGNYTDQYGANLVGQGIRVSLGDVVEAGTVLGYTGSSGASFSSNQTPAHLHIEFGLSLTSVNVLTNSGTVQGLFVLDDLPIGSIQFETPVNSTQTSLSSSNTASFADLGNYIVATSNNGFIAGQSLTGTSGDDVFLGGPGIDSYDGGNGSDTISTLDRTGTDWIIDLSSNSGFVDAITNSDPQGSGLETLVNVENAWLGDGDDVIILSFEDNEVRGGAGIDRVVFNGTSSEYTFSNTNQIDGIMVSGGGNDIFYGVEEFEFSDGVFAWNNLPSNSSSGPDVVVTDLSIANTTLTAGDTLDVDYIIRNSGDSDFGSTGIAAVYLSTNSTITTSDTLLGDESFRDLTAGGSDSEGQNFTIPGSLAPGTYWIGIIADTGDSISESDEGNNVSPSPIQITIQANAGTPDLSASDLTLSSLSWQIGDEIDADWNINNFGNGEGEPSGSRLYLSTDANITTSDYILATDSNTGTMSVGEINAEGRLFTVGSDLAPGVYWIGVIADYADVVLESDEANNMSNLIQITIEGPSLTNLTEGNDIYSGTSGQDIVNGLGGNDTLRGLGGDDILDGGGGADTLDGGTGNDTVSYEGSVNRVNVNLLSGVASSGHATGDSFVSIENLLGSNFGDNLRGDNGINVINGAGGQDVLIGYNGNDQMYGGSGRDILNGGDGGDILDGGEGADQARYSGSSEAVQIDLLAGTASGGQAQGDTLINIENLFGSNHNDTLYGDANNNKLFGHLGDDVLAGNGGIDKLYGGSGSDSFVLSDGFAYVMDFVDDVDQLDVSACGFTSLADALANLDQVGNHARFRFDGDVLFVLNTDVADLANDIVI